MSRRGSRGPRPAENGADIDARYGLEPVFDPAALEAGAGVDGFAAVACPYCGETFDTAVDLSAGSATYIEDCQICCQPIELELRVSERGTMTSLGARRLD